METVISRGISVSERLLRREAVDNAVADLRLEGLIPSADARLTFERFVQGELTEEQLLNAILAR
ncbi:MAG TPA: antitoxin VbhA family protein [Candidatus Angelobacter sp.]|nr:antitoxin VbhA family protein [Candidatus Angelobacter sp.]